MLAPRNISIFVAPFLGVVDCDPGVFIPASDASLLKAGVVSLFDFEVYPDFPTFVDFAYCVKFEVCVPFVLKYFLIFKFAGFEQR